MDGTFQILSYASTSGFATADNSAWPLFPCLLMMYVGVQCGMAGSTTGGLKSDRVMMLFKAIGRQLRRSRGQLDTAMAQLQEVGLASGALLPGPPPAPQPDNAPEYTSSDIVSELQDKSSPFSALLAEVESLLGKKLSTSQTATLLELYDHVGLPSEVLLVMVSWLNARRTGGSSAPESGCPCRW